MGRAQLAYELRFDEGRGLVVDPKGTVLVVAPARDLVRTAYEHAMRVEGKPQSVRVRCVGEPVFIGEPGEAAPCIVNVRDGAQAALIQLLDAQGRFEIVPAFGSPSAER